MQFSRDSNYSFIGLSAGSLISSNQEYVSEVTFCRFCYQLYVGWCLNLLTCFCKPVVYMSSSWCLLKRGGRMIETNCSRQVEGTHLDIIHFTRIILFHVSQPCMP